jgi:formate hydrogenlyase subunit 6/NADH:ubiquinone oxidoreductase subunit I
VMTRRYELASYDKNDFFLDKEWLIANQVNAHKELYARPADEARAPAGGAPANRAPARAAEPAAGER